MDIPEHTFREKNLGERRKYQYQNMLRFVTKEEIIQTKMELWEKMKPMSWNEVDFGYSE